MKFQPKTEQEIRTENLWQPGEYGFEVLAGTPEVSNAGNDMIKLKVAIFNSEGRQRIVFDYLMESIAYKLRHACEVMGLLAQYETGNVEPDDFVGKTGRLKLSIKKDKTGQYADQNAIADYLTEKHGGTNAAPVVNGKGKSKVSAPIPDDSSIPF